MEKVDIDKIREKNKELLKFLNDMYEMTTSEKDKEIYEALKSAARHVEDRAKDKKDIELIDAIRDLTKEIKQLRLSRINEYTVPIKYIYPSYPVYRYNYDTDLPYPTDPGKIYC